MCYRKLHALLLPSVARCALAYMQVLVVALQLQLAGGDLHQLSIKLVAAGRACML